MRNIMKLSVPMLCLAMAVYGCAKPEKRCLDPEDNPPHHYMRGMVLLENGDLDAAMSKFERALFCDKRYGPAHAGLAIVNAERARGYGRLYGEVDAISAATGSPGDADYRLVDVDRAFEHLNHAYKYAQTKEEKFAYRVASIRVYTALKTEKWLKHIEGDFKKAMKLKVDERKLLFYEGRESAFYFMGVAYLEAKMFHEARDRFSDVLSEKRAGRWNGPADRMWKKVDKIVRALAGITVGDVGKQIASKSSVTRGDVAALLADELKIDRLFAGRIPVKSEIKRLKPDFIPMDVLDHHFREEVLLMMKWDIRGLEPRHDKATRAILFKPDDPTTRKEFALVLEDVLIKLTGDSTLASAFFGHAKSPFPDVPPTAAWYNAVMNVTTRGLMEAELSGEFRPDDTLDGAEAILAIRVLRQRMNIY